MQEEEPKLNEITSGGSLMETEEDDSTNVISLTHLRFSLPFLNFLLTVS